MSSHERFSTASVAVVLAAGASLFLLAAAQADPQAAAETRYLAFWSTAVLLCAAGLSKQPSFELAGSALLLVLTGWVVPAGPARAATFGLLLTASLGVAILRRLADHSDGIDRSFWVPAALGVQFLARSDQLLTNSMEPKALVGLVVLPLAAAWSLNLLGRSRGVGATLLIGGVCLLLVPGWSVAVLLSLAGVVLGSQSVAGETNRWIRLGGLVLVTVAAYTWHPGLPAVILLTALLIASGERWVGPAAVAMAVAIALVLLPGVRAWDESLLQAGLLLVLLPAAPLVGRKDWPRVISALLLACLAARTVPLPGALAAPLAAVALSLPREGTLVTLQRIWTGTLLAGSLLLAAYPWLRVEPLSDTLQLFGARGDWSSVLGVVIGFLVIGWLVEKARIRKPRALLPAGVVLAVLAVAALLQLPPAGVYSVTGAPVVLTFEQHGFVRDVEVDAPIRSIVIDSYLENSTSLATGTPVAEVTLDTEDGNNQRWLLRVGIESGEWAARREDVASLEGFQAPPPWLTWIPGGSELFAQRYRARWDPPEQATATRIRVARRPELPPEVGIAILRLELRP
jgi:hypothetical protein